MKASTRSIRKRSKTNYQPIPGAPGLHWLRAFVGGNQCKTDEPGCPMCDYWHFRKTRGRFPYEEEDGQVRREPKQ